MKINIRLILLTFTIVVLVTVSSSLVYYSLTNQIITAEQNQNILNATSDFIFNFEIAVDDLEENYKRIINRNSELASDELNEQFIDFVFTLEDERLINFDNFAATNKLNIRSKNLSLTQFLSDNPNLILKYDIREDGTYYYGKVLTEDLLNQISEHIRANIALVVNQTPSEVNDSEINQKYLSSVIDGVKYLRFKNQYDIYKDNYGDYDFYSTYYSPSDIVARDYKLGFLIFTTPRDVVEFRYNSGVIALIITLVGIALALIFVFIFTSKLRDQISKLSYAAEVTGKGNLNYRVPLESKDELGKLGEAFNNMLDDLKNQKEAEKEYTDFISLLNQKPTLKEIAEVAVQKIIKSTGISFGVLYLVKGKDYLQKIASYGIKEGVNEQEKNFDYYKSAIEQKDIIEFKYKKNLPVVRTGISEIRIKYIVIVPIVYSNDVVAVIELASEEIPQKDIKKYLLTIREQLAIGIINGSSFEQLQRFVDELRSLNEDYELQNEELRKVQSELELKADQLDKERLKALESTKLKSQFLTNITHELKTPLNSIIGLSGLIKNDSEIPNRHIYRLEVIIRNSKKLLTLINNILEFSKTEAGKTTIKNETFSLGNFLNEINSIVQPYALEKGLNYICDAPDDIDILLHTDKAKLEQILINLLNNSIKFTEEGLVKIKASLLKDDSIQFEVKDTGIGIDKKDKEAIFEEFRQADGTISRQYDGTGLGLSICKRFVELLGGTFNLESEVGSGSEFTVLLPDIVFKADPHTEKRSAQFESPKLKKRVMVIDVSKTTKKLIGDYLELNEYKIVEPDSENEIEDQIAEKKVDCVILNQSVYKNNGWQILSNIKADPKTKSVITIMIASDEENNYGYGLALHDILPYINFEENIENILDGIRSDENVEALSVISFSKIEDVNEVLIKANKVSVQINKVIDNDQLNTDELPRTDVIFFDLTSAKVISYIDKIKHNRRTRSIRLIGILPEAMTLSQERDLSNGMISVMKERKHHIIDVLKIFRDRLKIAENEFVKTKLLLDEDTAEVVSENENDGKIKVMIVDDDRDTLYTVGEIVKSAGYDPVYAKNGVECILALKNETPSLILLDIMMPKMDGFETLKEIRKHAEYDEIPVIAITAYAMLDDKEIVDKSGFNDIITKPIDSEVIHSKLRIILNKRVKIDE